MSSNDLPGYARAQREYDNRTPPDDGPSECPDCDGRGSFIGIGDVPEEGDYTECASCKGSGYLNDDGTPFNPNAAAEAAEERADYERDRLRDERMTNGRDPIDEYDF
jgi:hypothetical protein